MVSNGAPAINSTFLTSSMRNVVGEGGGIYHALWGTIIVTSLAAVMSIPIGLLTGDLPGRVRRAASGWRAGSRSSST